MGTMFTYVFGNVSKVLYNNSDRSQEAEVPIDHKQDRHYGEVGGLPEVLNLVGQRQQVVVVQCRCHGGLQLVQQLPAQDPYGGALATH